MIELPEEELDDQPIAPLVPLSFNRKFKISERKLNPKIALADEISKAFGLTFPHIMKIISDKGLICTGEVFREVLKSSCRNPVALFLYRIKNVKIDFQ